MLVDKMKSHSKTINKRSENNLPIGRPRKRWIDELLDTPYNI
jgi:hypothetical protein